MSLRLYNTLTHSSQPFEPLHSAEVTMYVCGPTVYDDPHLGHVRSACIFDVFRRYLEHQRVRVRFIRNVTDVDDKIIQRARDSGESTEAVAERYLKSYHEALRQLGVGEPTEEPRATAHVVPDMTDLIAKLLVNGVAYEAGGDVYFAVRKFSAYGQLSRRSLDNLEAGARVEPGEQKQDPLDFALWKAAKPDEPSWDSPWGKGRPGWHIECSAMSTRYLGETFDIHGGGLDLVFPHHENELAQAQAAGKPFARCWMHHGLLTTEGEKMSKSLGNFVTVTDVLARYPHPDYLKIFFLKTHYRSPIDYSPRRIEEAKTNCEEFFRFFQHYDQVIAQAGTSGGRETGAGAQRGEIAKKRQLFDEAMDNDLNTPQALAVLFDLVNLGHQILESQASKAASTAREVQEALVECGMTLGLFHQGTSEEDPTRVAQIRQSLAERDAARANKDFTRADAIRQQLRQEGVLLTDTPTGTLWRRQR